jgi:hypothetical protein
MSGSSIQNLLPQVGNLSKQLSIEIIALSSFGPELEEVYDDVSMTLDRAHDY